MTEPATGTVAPESAPATGGNASDSQQPTGTAPTGSAEQQTQTQAAPATTIPDNWEWNGNVDEVEPPFRKRALGMQRYLTKRTQELSDSQRKAEEFDRIKADPLYQQFLTTRGQQQQVQTQAPQAFGLDPAQVVSPNEWAQMGLDPAVGNMVNKLVESRLMAAEQNVIGKLQELQARQAQIERSTEISDFAELHPDFWELYDAGILKPLVTQMVDSGQGSLPEAYEKAKAIKDSFTKKAMHDSQQRVTQKKAAFSSPPTPSSASETIWVDNPQDSFRAAFENALLNKRVTVRTRR